jgi:hypothetical protein
MKFLGAIVCSLLMGLWSCGALAATANGSFNYDFTTDPACAATVTGDCIDHFEIWDVTATPAKLATVAAPATPGAAVTFNFKIGPPYGARKWSAVAVAKSGSTSDMAAPQSQATVTVRPGAPAAFVVNMQ